MGDINVVYRLEKTITAQGVDTVDLPIDCRLVSWEPSLLKIVPDNIGFEKMGFIKNWVFHFPRLFNGHKLYSVHSLMSGAEVVCQCILTPGSSRYQFMAPDDLQFGLVYTSPDHRNKKLANAMVKAIIQQLGNSTTYWWLTECDNFASRKLAERVGFELIGTAARKSIMGFSYYTLMTD